MRASVRIALAFVLVTASARAQPEPPRPQPEPAPSGEPTPADPKDEPRFERFDRAPNLPVPETPPPPPPPPEPPKVETASEGRLLVSAWNTGLQWGISPGIVFSGGDTGFALGARVSYGVDLDRVILVPGVRASAYFLPSNVWLGMPTAKLVVPIDRIGPFVEAGAGVGYVSGIEKTGLAWMAGGGVAFYSTHFALGAEASYQSITGTGFDGWGIGPILAIGF